VTPEIHWDGEQTRDFVYVGDCARANLLALERGDGQAYNVGTGIGTSVNTLFSTFMDVTGQDMTPRRGPRRPGDTRHSYLDSRKIERELVWQASISLREGLEKTWNYFAQFGWQTTGERFQPGKPRP
jgi:UDP-glucose 4-epimerase